MGAFCIKHYYNIHSPSLSFVRSGNIFNEYGSLRFTAYSGYLIASSTGDFIVSSWASAIRIALTDADVYPSDGSGGRWRAFPLRYLARVLDIIHLSYYQDFYEHQQG